MSKLQFPRYVLRSLLSIPRLGVIGSVKLLFYRYVRGDFTLKCRSIPRAFKLRGGTTDLSVAYTITCHGDYDFGEIGNVDSILDCGAYIGISALHLKSKLGARAVIAVEPNPENYRLLAENCSGDADIKCIHGAVWHEKRDLRIVNPNAEKYSFQCSASGEGASSAVIKAHTMSDLLDELEEGRILVKMDIEGAEKDVFSANADWLSRVDYLIMEIHPGCWKAVFDALAPYDYDCRFSGENFLFIFDRAKSGAVSARTGTE